MKFDAIHVSPAADEPRYEGTTLSDPRDFLSGLRAKGGRRVVLIQQSQASAFSAPEDLVIDRGEKRSVELSRKLVGRDKVPLLRVEYRSRATLANGINGLMRSAETRVPVDENVYVLALEHGLFDTLWEDARPLPVLPETAEPVEREVRSGASNGDSGTPIAENDASAAEDPPADVGAEPATFSAERPWRLRLQSVHPPDWVKDCFIGDSEYAEEMRRLATLAARRDQPVLIFGPTGTGKDVLAHLIHRISRRSGGEYTQVNCAAVPEGLFETEFFGAAKGAATGVSARMGYLRASHRGTLFLDEVAELDYHVQAKLLKVLESDHVRPVGDSRDHPADVRVVAATNRNLHRLIETGQFRKALYHRLKGFWIQTKALREHSEDIAPLANWYWRKEAKDSSSTLPGAAIEALEAYSWPGNVRELRLVIQSLYSFIGDAGIVVGPEHVRAVLDMEQDAPRELPANGTPMTMDLVWYYRALRLRHLRRVDVVLNDVMNRIKVFFGDVPAVQTVQPVGREARDMLAEIDRLLDVFEELCDAPRTSFADSETYRLLRILRRTLRGFFALMQATPEAARVEWKRLIWSELDIALRILHRDVNQLVQVDSPPSPTGGPFHGELGGARPTFET